MEKEFARNPRDLREGLFLSALYSRSLAFNPELTSRAIELSDKLLTISSTKQDIYFNTAELYAQLGDFDKAIGFLETAVNLAPQFEKPKTNLAVINIFAKQNDIKNGQFDKAKSRDEKVSEILGSMESPGLEILKRIASAYLSIGEAEPSYYYANLALEKNPNDFDLKGLIIDSLVRLGRLNEAKVMAEELKINYPEAASQVDAFLKALEENSSNN